MSFSAAYAGYIIMLVIILFILAKIIEYCLKGETKRTIIRTPRPENNEAISNTTLLQQSDAQRGTRVPLHATDRSRDYEVDDFVVTPNPVSASSGSHLPSNSSSSTAVLPYPLKPLHPTPHKKGLGFDYENTIKSSEVGPSVNITTQPISASPVVVPPYPVEPRHPTPHAGAPAPGFAAHQPPYPTHTPYPAPVPVYYPPPMGGSYPPAGPPYPSTGAPYPPASTAPYPTGDYGAQPPSYSEAVAQPNVQPLPVKEGYAKQAPYNPHY